MLEYEVRACAGDKSQGARELLLELMKGALGEGAEELFARLYKNENGKPVLPAESGLFVSISHSGGCVAAAVADSPVGIDIEEMREPLTAKKTEILERFFAGEDTEKAKADKSGREFYVFWTRREAAFKAYATRPFYTEDPTKDRENTIFSDIITQNGKSYALAVACENK
ncbi:MAG: 4'-phosphopantetheinyl transferase superfamily protein [Clostridia bacterium]|nr:4'-phosphopantetheinyl transferase superfamily protein [Clostridia bacterium]